MRLTGYDRPIYVHHRPILGGTYGLHWAHAGPGGLPCLRVEVSWRTISGVLLNTPWFAVWVYFRRWKRWA